MLTFSLQFSTNDVDDEGYFNINEERELRISEYNINELLDEYTPEENQVDQDEFRFARLVCVFEPTEEIVTLARFELRKNKVGNKHVWRWAVIKM